MLRVLSVLGCLAPLPALALSCVPYGVPDAYQEAAAAEDGYVPVLGQIDFDPDLLPEVDWNNQQDVPPTTLIPATFRGDALSVRGVAQPFETDVVLEVQCFGPWCPQPRPGRALAFLRQTSHSYVLSTTACGGFLFDQPTASQIKEVEECLAGRACRAYATR